MGGVIWGCEGMVDHMPLLLKLAPSVRDGVRRRFKFENVLLQEGQCREV